MWSQKSSKISVVILVLAIFLHTSRAATTVTPLTDDATTPQDLNNDAVTVESFNLNTENGIETTTIFEDEASVTTETAAKGESATEYANNYDDITTTESVNSDASTTESIIDSTTDQIECACDCVANGVKVTLGCTTELPGEKTTQTATTASSEGQKTFSNNDSTLPTAESTVPTVEAETSTDTIATETTTELNSEAGEPQTTTVEPIPICSTPGVQAHELDCQQYYDCSLQGSTDGSLHLLTKSCLHKQAFNIELNRCSRDISSCTSLPIQCLAKGGVADPASNSSYYLCEPTVIAVGFRIFHVDCAANEIFYPALGKCFLDFNNLPAQGYPPFIWHQIRDIDIVKAELKLLKEQDKLKLKLEKDRKKAEEKLQKELEKEAKKKAKEEEKANKEKAKQQAANVVCLQEGNVASEIGENIYFACIAKKGKLKAVPMQCSFGAQFNAETGSCINNATGVNSSNSEEEEEDN